MKAKITIAVFIAMIGGLSLLNLLTPAQAFSQNENRYLQQQPELTLSTLLSGKYTADFDSFVIDQFAFRDSWVGLKTLSERAVGKQNSSGVYFGKDGYLMEMFDTINQRQFQRNLDYVSEFSHRISEELGTTVNTALVPTATYILADKLPAFAPELDQQALLSQAGEAIPAFVDMSSALLEHRDDYVYYRTDHHWTSLGAFYGYNAWRSYQGLPQRPLEDYKQDILSDAFYGTTYSKASLYTASPDTITAFSPWNLGQITVEYNNGETVTDNIYTPSYLEVKDKYSVFLNANQPVVHIETETQNQRHLLLIKDSYANTFVQFLLEDYQEITVVDLRYFRQSVYGYIADNNITDVLILYNLKGFSSDSNLFYLTQ